MPYWMLEGQKMGSANDEWKEQSGPSTENKQKVGWEKSGW